MPKPEANPEDLNLRNPNASEFRERLDSTSPESYSEFNKYKIVDEEEPRLLQPGM